MAANLFGGRFFSFRKPAWHDPKGVLVLKDPFTASEAFEKMGTYHVYLEAIQTVSGLPLDERAVLRAPTPDDPTIRKFGIVGPKYTLIPPADLCTTWDSAVNRPVETIGALGQGDTFFISTKLPTFDVKGDEVENYMLLVAPMTGFDAIQGRVTPVRVVCQNTLVAAQKASTEVHRIIHDEHAIDRLAHWLTGAYDRALQRADEIARSFRAMAETPISDPDRVIELIYTMPALPRKDDAPAYLIEQRQKNYDYQVHWTEQRRDAVHALFDGKGMGMDMPAAQGTAYGLYNAVVELEDYSNPRPNSGARGTDALIGLRADRKARAYEYCLVEAQRADRAPKATKAARR